MKESKDLKPYWQHVRSGKVPDLHICGYDLTAMLEEFAASKLARSGKLRNISEISVADLEK